MYPTWTTSFLIDADDPMLSSVEAPGSGPHFNNSCTLKTDPINPNQYLVKEMKSHISDIRKYLKFIEMLCSLKNDNIAEFFGYIFQTESQTSKLIYKYVNNSLGHHIKSNKLSNIEKNHVFECISQGLCYLHNRGIVHGNLTMNNILINEGNEARIADFGVKYLFSRPNDPIPTKEDDISAFIDIVKELMSTGEKSDFEDYSRMKSLLECETEEEKRQYSIHQILSIAQSLPTIRIYVKTLTGRIINLAVTHTMTIFGVKMGIYRAFNHEYEVGSMRLIYAGAQLEDNYKIDEYHIMNNSTLHLVLRESRSSDYSSQNAKTEPKILIQVTFSNDVYWINRKIDSKKTIAQIKEGLRDEISIPTGLYSIQLEHGYCCDRILTDIDERSTLESFSNGDQIRFHIGDISPTIRVECIDDKAESHFLNFKMCDTTAKVCLVFTKLLKLSYNRFSIAVDGREIPPSFEENKHGVFQMKKQFLIDFNAHDGSKFTIASINTLPPPTMSIRLENTLNPKQKALTLPVSPEYTVNDLTYLVPELMNGIYSLVYNQSHLGLDSNKTLGSLGIEDGTIISMMLRLKGGKPVIYLYPDQETPIEAKVRISMDESDGRITTRYPVISPKEDQLENIWRVTANKDGEIFYNGRKHYYLFWECVFKNTFEINEGFVVEGEKCFEFFEEKLSYLGLNEREANDFITYWCPQMEHSEFVLIGFQGDQYTSRAPLTIDPLPDRVHRIFMTFKLLDKEISIPEQDLTPFRIHERTGFFVLEWGGAMI